MNKKDPNVVRSNVFVFRLSDRDRAALNALAKASSRSPSDYIRWLINSQIFDNLDNQKFMENYRPFLEKDAKETSQIFEEIKRLAGEMKAAGSSGHIVLGKEDGTSYEVDL